MQFLNIVLQLYNSLMYMTSDKQDIYNLRCLVAQLSPTGHIVRSLNIHDCVDVQKVCTHINGMFVKNTSDGTYMNITCLKMILTMAKKINYKNNFGTANW